MPLNIVLIVAGFCLLTGGAWLLVKGASSVAEGFGVSHMVIGATIVALGTSLPELLTVIVASIQKKDAIGLGNIVGSNIINVIGILGIGVLILPVAVNRSEITNTTLIAFVAASLYLLYCMIFRGRIGRIDGLILVTGFVVYTWFSYATGKVPLPTSGEAAFVVPDRHRTAAAETGVEKTENLQ